MLHDARLLLHLSPLFCLNPQCIRLCGLFILTLLSKLYSAFCLRSLAHRVRRHLHPNQESEGIPFFHCAVSLLLDFSSHSSETYRLDERVPGATSHIRSCDARAVQEKAMLASSQKACLVVRTQRQPSPETFDPTSTKLGIYPAMLQPDHCAGRQSKKNRDFESQVLTTQSVRILQECESLEAVETA